MTEPVTGSPDEDTRPKIEELIGSLNGWEEIAIEKAFGKGLGDLSASLTARAAVMVVKRRGGEKDTDAFRAAMDMSISAVNDAFQLEDPADDLADEGNG